MVLNVWDMIPAVAVAECNVVAGDGHFQPTFCVGAALPSV